MKTTPGHSCNRNPSRLNYNKGCRCEGCRAAAARYERGRQWDILQGRRRHVDITGTRRRLQALCRLGWTFPDQAKHLGVSPELVSQWAKTRKVVTRRTAERVAAMYDALSMTLPPTDTGKHRAKVAKCIKYAERNGWAPPLAWDDIDDPAARPSGTSEPAGRKQYLDHAAIERRINGDRSVRVTSDEAREIVRRLYRRGFGAKWIDDNLGIKAERYLKWSEFQSEIGGAA